MKIFKVTKQIKMKNRNTSQHIQYQLDLVSMQVSYVWIGYWINSYNICTVQKWSKLDQNFWEALNSGENCISKSIKKETVFPLTRRDAGTALNNVKLFRHNHRSIFSLTIFVSIVITFDQGQIL